MEVNSVWLEVKDFFNMHSQNEFSFTDSTTVWCRRRSCMDFSGEKMKFS